MIHKMVGAQLAPTTCSTESIVQSTIGLAQTLAIHGLEKIARKLAEHVMQRYNFELISLSL